MSDTKKDQADPNALPLLSLPWSLRRFSGLAGEVQPEVAEVEAEVTIDDNNTPAKPTAPETSRWWQWSQQMDSATPPDHAIRPEPASFDWWIPYKKLTAVVTAQNETNDPPQADKSEQEPQTWWNWVWGSTPDDEDVEDGVYDLRNAELFKSAKIAIESSRDSSHYAIKSSTQSSDFELAVCGTETELFPVKYKTKKRPITPNELQENTILQSHKTLEESLENSKKATASHPSSPKVNASSNSSVKSNKSYKVHKVQVVPQFYRNYREITLKTKLRLVGEHLIYAQNSSEKHLYRLHPDRIIKRKTLVKKVTVIGVHGFLPIKMVKTLIGQSTHNSIGYVGHAVEAIQLWFEHEAVDIQTIALEGEGTIDSRVTELYKLLQNWKDLLNQSDFIFFVAQSQGTPIAIDLLAKLLKSEHLSHKKIGLLSLSGLFYGPFPGLDSKLVIRAYTSHQNEIINELFELQKPGSDLSIKLNENMNYLLKHNIKITVAGSVTDQLVPLYSSLACNYHHPNLFRCIHSDPSVPQFITSLFESALTLRNLGYSDHSIIRDLSEKCQGPVSNEGGHGKLYHQQDIYMTAVRHSLETTNLNLDRDLGSDGSGTTPSSSLSLSVAGETANLYHLPWNIRGLIHDLVRVKNIPAHQLVRELYLGYRDWDPTKQWREIKYCLQALEEGEDFLM